MQPPFCHHVFQFTYNPQTNEKTLRCPRCGYTEVSTVTPQTLTNQTLTLENLE